MFESLQDAFHIHSTLDLLVTVVDIALVYALIYQILIVIQGTRAVQILIGLLLVIIAYFLSKDEYLGLSTLNWLLDKFIGSFILLIVVLFQDDIRRGLAKFGKTRFFSGMSSSEEAHMIEQLVRASQALSERRVGALIAVEREADLSSYTEEAIKLDAQVSWEALFAIFSPANENPLHDGAVVVRRGRVVAAACFLPLTSNPRVDLSLGTRHRAAIGLSEDTDAAVLVVSEETGVVSLALAGRLSQNLDANSLRSLLRELLGARGPAPAPAPAGAGAQ